MDYCYRFSAVRGIQAGNEYYIGMVPLKMLQRLFPDEDDFILPEYRAQRRLNESRIPDIKNYILNNRDNYVFSALAASIDGIYQFNEIGNNVGILEVSMDAKFLINDGQHRKAAILAALEEAPELASETISVVFFEDQGLTRSQQMFTDLNKHAVKTSNSIAELYDSRDDVAVITRNIISQISFLDEYVDKERDILGKYSSALFTLNTFYLANKRILKRGSCSPEFESFLLAFWSSVVNNMNPWAELVNKALSKKELREQYIATQSIVIQAFGKVGTYYWDNKIMTFSEQMPKLREINWKRSARVWKNRVIRKDGRIINNDTVIGLTANTLKRCLGIPLTKEEQILEKKTI